MPRPNCSESLREIEGEDHMSLHELSLHHLHRTVAGFCLALITAIPASAQDFPTRPVKIITDSAPGSAVDVILRVIADRLTQIWGQQVLPVNQPGAGGSTLPDLIALAKQRPGELIYGTNGRGRLTHLTGELLASRAGIKLLMVPYSGGTAQVLSDVLGGRVPLVIEAYSGVAG